MTQEEILDGNLLIAEFLGFKFKDEICQNEVFYTNENQHCIYLQGCSIRCASFNNSWDWIMPCVKKCMEIDRTRITNDLSVSIFTNNHIEIVWKAVVKFIKWYNENKS